MAENEREKIVVQIKGFDAAHYQTTQRYSAQVHFLANQAAKEYTQLAGTLFQPDLSKPFNFDDFPQTKAKAAKITKTLAGEIEGVVLRGTESEWKAACDKNDAFIKSILKTSRLTPEEAEQFMARNLEALQAFQQRKVAGMNLSDRVWQATQQIRDTIELGIDVGIGSGRSAAELSRDIRECLNNPTALFRRVRDKYGNLQLSKAAKLYHPGQGVYRSAAQNAMRLARTEINMAYRAAEFLRWQQLDFVVGIRICLSNNHTIIDRKTGKPVPFTDICDELQGDYPKTFKFVGWHPNCRCFAIPILSDYDEYNKERAGRLKAIVQGAKYKSMPSRRTVTAMPENFTNYIASIAETSKRWKSQPYYIRDNFQGGTIAGGLKAGIAETLKGNPTGTKPEKKPVKNNSKPITEYDNEIAGYKRWAFALGLNLSRVDALRLGGDKAALRAELDAIDNVGQANLQAWYDQLNALYALRQQLSRWPAIEKKYAKISNDNRPVTTRYYGDCIKNLQQAIADATIELAKKLKEESAKDYSSNMPIELKSESHYLDGEKYKFNRKFFDMLKKQPQLTIKKTGGCYETDNGDTVVLTDGDRWDRSAWHRKSVVYHEFGHAIADQRNLLFDTRVTALRDKQIARLRKKVKGVVAEQVYDFDAHQYKTVYVEKNMMLAKHLTKRLDAFRSRIQKMKGSTFTKRGITRDDVIEQICETQDTLRSLINSQDVGWGHSVSYFKGWGMQQHEYLAHCFENTFIGNRVFEHFMPQEYKEMIELIREIQKQYAP